MNDPIDKAQLKQEIELVEKILALAEKPETLDEAADFFSKAHENTADKFIQLD